MQATIIRIRMQIQKLRDELACLENQIDILEKDTKKKTIDKFEENFSRNKEDFIAP